MGTEANSQSPPVTPSPESKALARGIAWLSSLPCSRKPACQLFHHSCGAQPWMAMVSRAAGGMNGALLIRAAASAGEHRKPRRAPSPPRGRCRRHRYNVGIHLLAPVFAPRSSRSHSPIRLSEAMRPAPGIAVPGIPDSAPRFPCFQRLGHDRRAALCSLALFSSLATPSSSESTALEAAFRFL